MSFFDQKQEVFDIQLTSHGKKLLAQGKLEPEYYAFFDDDILYDARYAGSPDEEQNYIAKRIKEETPRLKTQYNFTRLEKKDRSGTKYVVNTDTQTLPPTIDDLINAGPVNSGPNAGFGQPYIPNAAPIDQMKKAFQDEILLPGIGEIPGMKEVLGPTYDYNNEFGILNNYIMQEPIGTSDLGNRYAPSWDLQCYRGQISSSVEQLYTNRFPTLKIPQVEIECNFTTVEKYDINFAKDITNTIAVNNALAHIGEDEIIAFEDGTYIEVKRGEILLELEEENVPYGKDNYEAEVFFIEDSGLDTERWIKLYFNPETKTENAFYAPYVNFEEENKVYVPPQIENILANFLEITFDEEISEEVICNTRAELKNKNLFSDVEINCEDIETFSIDISDNDIYGETLEDTGEIC
tara:strand:+ start:1194 stop:2417 length:1224 start_codon:yes stop_codon:yes gene_type:complete